jgi:hypothetical protein
VGVTPVQPTRRPLAAAARTAQRVLVTDPWPSPAGGAAGNCDPPSVAAVRASTGALDRAVELGERLADRPRTLRGELAIADQLVGLVLQVS